MSNMLMRNRSQQQSRVPQVKIRRSIFDAKWSRKQPMNASFITPIMCKKVVPGQSMFLNLTNFSRLNTQVTCPMDNLVLETFFFYCPERVVWDNHPYFIGAIKDPNNITDYLTPQVEIPASANKANSLFNYLSASRLGKKVKVSSIPFRIHNLIYNEYFRDSDCESPKPVNKSDTDDTYTDFDLYRIHKSRDYFTNSTRDIQKGDDVSLPLGTTAPVISNGNIPNIVLGQSGSGTPIETKNMVYNKNSTYEALRLGSTTVANGTYQTRWGTETGLVTDLTNATAAKIQALRQAIMTEEYLEAINRGGSHYTDLMRNVYGVTIPDLTIQRPMYLGGTSTPFFTNPIIQTSESGATPQGNIAGFGTTAETGRVINASFEEFGYVIGYAVVKAMPQYQQGLERFWTEKDKYEYFNPFFINLSDQDIKRSEIFLEDYDAVDTNGEILNDKTFGFIGRYDQMRYFKNEIAGEFNSEYQYTLDSWHYAEKFENAPENNADFMHDKTYDILDRTMAVIYEDEEQQVKAPQIMADFEFNGAVALPIPTHAVPKIANNLL